MTRRLAGVGEIIVPALVLGCCLFLERARFGRDLVATVRDPGTQWLVFLCAGIYCLGFTALSWRRAGVRLLRNASGCLASPDLWLGGLLLLSGAAYFLDYSRASTTLQPLALVAGAAIGKGFGLWRTWSPERAAQRTWALLLMLLILLVVGALWQPDGSALFQYRGLARWNGPWKNPNTFGLLMGVGVVLTGGLVLGDRRWKMADGEKKLGDGRSGPDLKFQISNLKSFVRSGAVWFGEQLAVGSLHCPHCNAIEADIQSQKSSVTVPRLSSPESQHSSISAFQHSFLYLKSLTCQLFSISAFSLFFLGLVKSYSRGAWVGTALGLAALGWQTWLRRWKIEDGRSKAEGGIFQISNLKSRIPGFSTFSPLCFLRVKTSLQSFSVSAFISLAMLVLSLSVIAFWQFRFTEFHPVRRVFSVGNPNDFSWRNRVAAWDGGLAMLADRPLTGFGWGQPERVFDQLYKPARVAEGMAFQLNHYLLLGTSLGLPALVCFLAYIVTGFRPATAGSACQDFRMSAFSPCPQSQTSDLKSQIMAARRAALVLLVGLWFDGGLLHLATAAPLWILLELGRGRFH